MLTMLTCRSRADMQRLCICLQVPTEAVQTSSSEEISFTPIVCHAICFCITGRL